MFKQFSDLPMPYSITQTGTGHHGLLGVPARALVVLKSKLASAHVAVYLSNVLEKGATQSDVQVRKRKTRYKTHFDCFSNKVNIAILDK